jgi:hypothetical protein
MRAVPKNQFKKSVLSEEALTSGMNELKYGRDVIS